MLLGFFLGYNKPVYRFGESLVDPLEIFMLAFDELSIAPWAILKVECKSMITTFLASFHFYSPPSIIAVVNITITLSSGLISRKISVADTRALEVDYSPQL